MPPSSALLRKLLTGAAILAFLSEAQAQTSAYAYRHTLPGLVVQDGTSAPAGAAFDVSTTSLSFGLVPAGSTSDLSFEVLNTGTAPLSASTLQVTGSGYSLTTACSQTLPAGQQCPATVRLTATAPGAYSGQATASFTGLSAKTVELSGFVPFDYSPLMAGYSAAAIGFTRNSTWTTAMGPTWYWNTASAGSNAAVGTVEFRQIVNISASTSVTAVVHGSTDNDLTALAVNGTTVPVGATFAFSGVTSSAPFTLQPGKNVVAVQVTNAPPAGSGNPAGMALEVRDTAGTLLAPVSGWFYWALSAAPANGSTTTFNTSPGSSATNTYTVVNSSSTAPVALAYNVTGSPYVTVASSTCGTSLAASSSCQITVRYAPPATNTFSATLQVSDATNNGSVSLALSGDTSNSFVYGRVSENGTLTLTAPSGKYLRDVVFASYGTSGGTGPNYTLGTCNATNSTTLVTGAFAGKASGSLNATNAVFGDPCVGTVKNLAVVMRAY